MKTAIIIHGMPSKEQYFNPDSESESNSHWLPWIQHELILNGILAQTPEMPIPYEPDYDSWKEVFERFEINENTILVGHSCGGGFIVRYLSENNIKVGKVILVAPWIDLEKKLNTGMFDFDVDENLIIKTEGVTIFSSNNDGENIKNSIKDLKQKIKNVKVVEFENMGHFTMKHMQTDKFPELLNEALK